MNHLEQQFENENFEGFITSSLELLANEETTEAFKQICGVLVEYYYTGNSAVITEILESIFVGKPEIIKSMATIENPFLLLCIMTGSMAIYKSYCEHYLDPIISELDENKASDYYIRLFAYFEKINETLFSNYLPVAEGKDYHGKMIGINEKPDFVMLMTKDYYKMEEIIENYNKIIGRSIIFKDITERVENC